MSRDEAGTQKLVDMGVTVAIVNAFDGAAVEQALRRSQAAVVIDQPTVLPKDPAGYAAAFPGDRKLRLACCLWALATAITTIDRGET